MAMFNQANDNDYCVSLGILKCWGLVNGGKHFRQLHFLVINAHQRQPYSIKPGCWGTPTEHTYALSSSELWSWDAIKLCLVLINFISSLFFFFQPSILIRLCRTWALFTWIWSTAQHILTCTHKYPSSLHHNLQPFLVAVSPCISLFHRINRKQLHEPNVIIMSIKKNKIIPAKWLLAYNTRDLCTKDTNMAVHSPHAY